MDLALCIGQFIIRPLIESESPSHGFDFETLRANYTKMSTQTQPIIRCRFCSDSCKSLFHPLPSYLPTIESPSFSIPRHPSFLPTWALVTPANITFCIRRVPHLS